MEIFIFTCKELLYIAKLLNISNIWGVENEFESQPDDDIDLEFIRAQDAISERGYTTIEFNDEFRLNDKLLVLIDTCKAWENMIVFDSSDERNNYSSDRYFINNNRIVRLRKEGIVYKLSYITKSELLDSMESFFPDSKEIDKDIQEHSVIASTKRMHALSNLRRSRFIDELQRIGCSSHLSILIANGVQSKTEHYEISALKRENGKPVLFDKLTVRICDEGKLIISPEKKFEHDVVRFSVWNKCVLREGISGIISQLDLGEENNG